MWPNFLLIPKGNSYLSLKACFLLLLQFLVVLSPNPTANLVPRFFHLPVPTPKERGPGDERAWEWGWPKYMAFSFWQPISVNSPTGDFEFLWKLISAAQFLPDSIHCSNVCLYTIERQEHKMGSVERSRSSYSAKVRKLIVMVLDFCSLNCLIYKMILGRKLK